MKPNKPGQVVKFHTPLPDEDPDQLYVVLEIKEDVEKPRADIKALNTDLSFPPIYTVLLEDLKVVEVDTSDLPLITEYSLPVGAAAGETAVASVGVIDQAAGTIAVAAVAGTTVTSLAATFKIGRAHV